MRLPEAKIKEAILHPERLVRDEALSYFTESFSRDAEVMPLAIQAIETFGRDAAFRSTLYLADVVQTDATVDWLIREVNRDHGPSIQSQDYVATLLRILCKADPKLLSPRADEIAKSPSVREPIRSEFNGRLERSTWDAERCWKELNDMAAAGIRSGPTISQWQERAYWTVEALARCPGVSEDRVLDLLAQKVTDYQKDPMVWMEEFGIILAGEMRSIRAMPLLVGKLRDDGDFVLEAAVDALSKIGTDAAVEAITAQWSKESWDFRLFATSALANIHTDTTIRKCLELLPLEVEEDIQTKLADALLVQFDDEAIEPVLAMVRSQSFDTDMTDLPARLVAVGTLLGITFPERETWKRNADDAKIKQEQRMKEFDRVFRAPPIPPSAKPKPKSKPLPAPRLAPVPAEKKAKVGRNDPCPCGSGKKFKVCCLRN